MTRKYSVLRLTIVLSVCLSWYSTLVNGFCRDHKVCKGCVEAFESIAVDYCLWCSKTNICFDLALNQTYCGGSSSIDTVSLAYESKCQSFMGMPLATGIIVLIVIIVVPICLIALGIYCFVNLRRSKPTDYQAMSGLDRRNKPTSANPSRAGYTYHQQTPRSAGYTNREPNPTPSASVPRSSLPPSIPSHTPSASLYAPLVQGASDSNLISLDDNANASQVISGYYLPPHLVPDSTMTGTFSSPFTGPPPNPMQVQARSSFIAKEAPAATPPPGGTYLLPKSTGQGFLDLEEDLQSVDDA